MLTLQEFAKAWLKAVDTVILPEEFVNVNKYGLCLNCARAATYEAYNKLNNLLISIYQTSDCPFDVNLMAYVDDDFKSQNPKRRAFAEAIAQGNLIVDDFGNVVIVKEQA